MATSTADRILPCKKDYMQPAININTKAYRASDKDERQGILTVVLSERALRACINIILSTGPWLIGSCLDLASPTRGRILAAFTAACLQTHLASRQEKTCNNSNSNK